MYSPAVAVAASSLLSEERATSSRAAGLAGRDELDAALAQLGPLQPVAPLAVLVEVAEVRVGHLVRVAAHVAPPLAAVVEPRDERVDVRAALLAADDAARAEVDDRHGRLRVRLVERHGLHDDAERQPALVRELRRVGHAAAREPHEVLRALAFPIDRERHLLRDRLLRPLLPRVVAAAPKVAGSGRPRAAPGPRPVPARR